MALPERVEEIAEILSLASEEGFPVVPRGAGTATTGAPLPSEGGLVLSLLRLNRILEINTEDLVAVVEPGVFNGTLKKEVAARGLFYPPDPASYEFSTVGGNVATCAGGPKGLKYGVTKDYVLGLEVVLPQGEVIFCGRRTMKGVVGYDLVHLFTGSEGTLGVITKIVLKLLPKPKASATLAAYFPSVEEAARGFMALMGRGLLPAATELLDDVTLEAVRDLLEEKPPAEAQALVLFEFDGGEKQVEEDLLQAKEALNSSALEIRTALEENAKERLWQARRRVSPALKKLYPAKVADDIVLPRRLLPRFLKEAKGLAKERGLTVACFGHLGDGNIHFNILFDPEKTTREAVEDLRKEILMQVISLSGTISGEHGIGLTKKGYLPRELSPTLLEIQKALKKVFDPKGILNPGKIFP